VTVNADTTLTASFVPVGSEDHDLDPLVWIAIGLIAIVGFALVIRHV